MVGEGLHRPASGTTPWSRSEINAAARSCVYPGAAETGDVFKEKFGLYMVGLRVSSSWLGVKTVVVGGCRPQVSSEIDFVGNERTSVGVAFLGDGADT